LRRKQRAQPWSRDPTPGAAVIVATVALAGFGLLTAGVLFFPAFHDIDTQVSQIIRSIAIPGLEPLARLLSFVGQGRTMAALTVLVAIWLLVRGMRPETVLLCTTMALGTLAGSVLKEVVDRARPGLEYARIPVPDTYSFPSGHALTAFLFFGVLAFLSFVMARSVRVKFWAWLACTLAVFGVAMSRVYLGVHYLGDVVASWMLGTVFLTLSVAVYVLWITRMRER